VQLGQLPAGLQQKGARPLLQPLVGLPGAVLQKPADANGAAAGAQQPAEGSVAAAAAAAAAAGEDNQHGGAGANGDAAPAAQQAGGAAAGGGQSGVPAHLALMQQASGGPLTAPVGVPMLPGMASVLQQQGLAGIPIANLQALQGHQLPAFIQPHQLALLQQGFSLPLSNGQLGALGQVHAVQQQQQQQQQQAAVQAAAAQAAAAAAAQQGPPSASAAAGSAAAAAAAAAAGVPHAAATPEAMDLDLAAAQGAGQRQEDEQAQ
jgi:hypothetical protein